MRTNDSSLPRICITQTPFAPQVWGGGDLALRMRNGYQTGARRAFPLVDSPCDADLIVFWEEYQEGEQPECAKLRREVAAIGDPDRVFVVSTEDRPIGFLPGVYVSTPMAPWSEHRFRTGAYVGNINPLIVEAAAQRDRSPKLLYSFIGAATSPVRRTILKTLETDSQAVIRETGNQQFNVGVDDPAKAPGQRSYLEAILDSHFVLCPRGHGSSSFRLFETMQMGRVPVILSDDWVPPRGPAWADFSVRVSEERVRELPEILAAFAASAREMGRLARSEWESWFAPEILPHRTLQSIYDIFLSRSHSERVIVPLWSDWLRDSQGRRPWCERLRQKASRSTAWVRLRTKLGIL